MTVRLHLEMKRGARRRPPNPKGLSQRRYSLRPLSPVATAADKSESGEPRTQNRESRRLRAGSNGCARRSDQASLASARTTSVPVDGIDDEDGRPITSCGIEEVHQI